VSVLATLPENEALAILALGAASLKQRAARPRRVVTFANQQQRTFYESTSPEILYSGAMGAGKSRILCEKAWYVASTFPGVTVGIFRKTADSIEATTQRTFERDVVEWDLLRGRNKTHRYYDLLNGSRIYFMGLDPDPITGVPSKVGSLDLAAAYVDEGVETTEGDYTMLQGRLRDPRIPWHQLGVATNPGPPTHWLKERFTPATESRVYLHATARDNIFVPQDYLARINDLPDTASGKRLGLGLWVGAEGVIWSLPDDQIRTEPGPWKAVEAGIDWGFVHAFACVVGGISGSGRLAVIDEVYGSGMTIDEIIPALDIVRRKHGISRFWADPSEPGYILQCQRAGLPVEPAHNAVSPGIDAVSTAIAKGMTVAPECTGLLGELPGYTWAPNKAGGFHERPIEVGDDACDALRYMVVGITKALEDNPWAALAGQRVGGVA
jgi:phage terminase large subunit